MDMAPSNNIDPIDPRRAEASGKKIAAGVLGIILGCLGIHKFILGYTGAGLTMILVSLLAWIPTCGLSAGVMAIIGLIEGIFYLTKTDDQFYEMYMVRKRPWF